MSSALPRQQVAAGELLQHISRARYRGQALFYGHDGSTATTRQTVRMACSTPALICLPP